MLFSNVLSINKCLLNASEHKKDRLFELRGGYKGPHARGLTSSYLRLVSATSRGDKYHRMNKPFLPQNLVAGTKILLLRLVPRIKTDLNLWDKSLRLAPQNDSIDQPSLMPRKPHALCFEPLFINFFYQEVIEFMSLLNRWRNFNL